MNQKYSSSELTDTIKPTLLHGYESENLETWMGKFRLHLERRRIKTDSKAAVAELALHLAEPAESFFSVCYLRVIRMILKNFTPCYANVFPQRIEYGL